jgi:RNA polymerase sigma-70 factor (ECF subfamily)
MKSDVSPSTASDQDLLAAWACGDLPAGRALFERYFQTLRRFLQNKTSDGLEDLMQQTWLACVERRAQFRGDASFRTYLLGIARFQLYAYYRRRGKRGEIDFGVASVADLEGSPSEVAAQKQQERLLLECLRRVPIDQQIVLELRFWQELSGPEIAEVLGIPEPAVRSRLRRATGRLRAELVALTGQGKLDETEDDLDRWALRLRAALSAPEG